MGDQHSPDGQSGAELTTTTPAVRETLSAGPIAAAQHGLPPHLHPLLEMLSNALETFLCTSEVQGREGSLPQAVLGTRTNAASLLWLYKALVYLSIGVSLATCPLDIPSPGMAAPAWPQSTL